MFLTGGYEGRTVRVTTIEPFTALTALDDDITADAGLPSSCADLLAMGAALALGAGREVSRNDTRAQGDTRRANEVPPGAQLGSLNAIRVQYRERLRSELALLLGKYPPRRP